MEEEEDEEGDEEEDEEGLSTLVTALSMEEDILWGIIQDLSYRDLAAVGSCCRSARDLWGRREVWGRLWGRRGGDAWEGRVWEEREAGREWQLVARRRLRRREGLRGQWAVGPARSR